MRITKYRTELDENRRNVLVKESATNYNADNLNNPQAITNMLNACFNMNRLAEEHLYLIALNTKNKPLGVFEVSHGTVNASLINPREIFIRLFLVGASNFIVSHNHPSGDCEPSKEDIQVTRMLKDCADMTGITLLDHIIIGDEYNSLKESGYIS